MARCGCSGSQPCSCFLEAGAGITVEGSGSPGTPYVISLDDSSTTVQDTATINMSITGSGTGGDPYVISGAVKLDPDVDNLLVATASGLFLDCDAIADCGAGFTTVSDTSSLDMSITGTGTFADPYVISGVVTAAATPDGRIPWASIPREAANSSTIATGTGNLRLSFFTASVSGTTTGVRTYTGSTAAAATPSIVQFGLYLLDATENGTLIASTTNDTSLLAAANTQYTKAWNVAAGIVAGSRYAIGMLVVTGVAAPTMVGASQSNVIQTENNTVPRSAAVLTGQASLPISFTAASLGTSANWAYMVAS